MSLSDLQKYPHSISPPPPHQARLLSGIHSPVSTILHVPIRITYPMNPVIDYWLIQIWQLHCNPERTLAGSSNPGKHSWNGTMKSRSCQLGYVDSCCTVDNCCTVVKDRWSVSTCVHNTCTCNSNLDSSKHPGPKVLPMTTQPCRTGPIWQNISHFCEVAFHKRIQHYVHSSRPRF